MTTFAQKVYPQKLGNGNYTIAEAGCLLTMFCNGLQVINGSAPDPVTLNQFFLENNVFIKDSDGALEDLAWNSITHFDPTITVSSVGTTAIPPSNLAGVEFHYNSVQTGVPIDHFCWVDHIENGQIYIIDSWDGLVKSPAEYEPTYHTPIAYATYVKTLPVPVPPVPVAPPAAPLISGNSEDTYLIVTQVPGYTSATQAVNHTGSNSTVQPRSYYVFNRAYDMINVTEIVGKAGWWINPADNVVPSPPTATVSAVTSTPTVVTVVPNPEAYVNPNLWKTTYTPFNSDRSVEYYQLDPALNLTSIVITDLAGQSKDLTLDVGENVPLQGTFSGPDDLLYGRTVNSVTNDRYYGFPMAKMIHETALAIYDTTTTPLERIATDTMNSRDKLLKIFHDIGKILDKFSIPKVH